MKKTLMTSALTAAMLAGCATHKDLLYTFTATGQVACTGSCGGVREISVRVVDTGLDYKRKKARFEIAAHPAVIGNPFRFDFDYFWGYTKMAGVQPPRRLVTIEALAPGCRAAPKEFDLDTVPQEDAHFTLMAQTLTVECE